MAAMASPLLEAGAIDGARGILINITGSSSLKLSEVNEASMIIQDAAHEDANIIFGAVLDESMGDDVKITVIATGFKQQEMPERRERMLAETTMPGSRYDVPVQPRVPAQRFPVNREQASQPERPMERIAGAAAPIQQLNRGLTEQRVDVVRARETMEPAQAPAAAAMPVREVLRPAVPSAVAPVSVTPVRPEAARGNSGAELVPVPASVFDDDFFRSGLSGGSRTEEHPAERVVIMEVGDPGPWDAHDFPHGNRVQEEGPRSEVFHVRAAEPGAKVQEYASADADRTDPDELDIPAFLRRGN